MFLRIVLKKILFVVPFFLFIGCSQNLNIGKIGDKEYIFEDRLVRYYCQNFTNQVEPSVYTQEERTRQVIDKKYVVDIDERCGFVFGQVICRSHPIYETEYKTEKYIAKVETNSSYRSLIKKTCFCVSKKHFNSVYNGKLKVNECKYVVENNNRTEWYQKIIIPSFKVKKPGFF